MRRKTETPAATARKPSATTSLFPEPARMAVLFPGGAVGSTAWNSRYTQDCHVDSGLDSPSTASRRRNAARSRPRAWGGVPDVGGVIRAGVRRNNRHTAGSFSRCGVGGACRAHVFGSCLVEPQTPSEVQLAPSQQRDESLTSKPAQNPRQGPRGSRCRHGALPVAANGLPGSFQAGAA